MSNVYPVRQFRRATSVAVCSASLTHLDVGIMAEALISKRNKNDASKFDVVLDECKNATAELKWECAANGLLPANLNFWDVEGALQDNPLCEGVKVPGT